MAELFAFDKETMYFWWNIKKCRSIVGSGISFCIGGVFWYSVRLGSVLGMWNATRFSPRFVPKLSIRFMSNQKLFFFNPLKLTCNLIFDLLLIIPSKGMKSIYLIFCSWASSLPKTSIMKPVWLFSIKKWGLKKLNYESQQQNLPKPNTGVTRNFCLL